MKTLYGDLLFKRPRLRMALLCLIVSMSSTALAVNHSPSFIPGDEPYSSSCDGAVRFAGWIRSATDNNGDISSLRFKVLAVSNPDIFTVYPWVSWPSLSLNYQIKTGTPGGLHSEVTAVLINDSGTGSGGTSLPQTWKIYTVDCTDSESVELQNPLDTDNDGINNDVDADDDNDGIPDVDEGSGVLDTDGDGKADSIDLDSDNDSIPDQEELADADGDGLRDSEEPQGNDIQTDTDGDGVHDGRDLDDDNDGIIDSLEGAGRTDTDNDGVVDSRDLDSDNDGRSDLLESGLDLIVLTFNESWSLENEVGENGLVDLVETFADSGFPLNYPVDADADGVPDFQDVFSPLISDDEPVPSGAPQTVSTGLEGVGCTLIGSAGSGRFDPVLPISIVLAFLALARRRKFAP